MRSIVRAAAVVAVMAGSIMAASGTANAAGITPITRGVVKSSPIVGHPKCPRCPRTPAVHGPFGIHPRGPVHGPVLR